MIIEELVIEKIKAVMKIVSDILSARNKKIRIINSESESDSDAL